MRQEDYVLELLSEMLIRVMQRIWGGWSKLSPMCSCAWAKEGGLWGWQLNFILFFSLYGIHRYLIKLRCLKTSTKKWEFCSFRCLCPISKMSFLKFIRRIPSQFLLFSFMWLPFTFPGFSHDDGQSLALLKLTQAWMTNPSSI